MLKHSLYLYNKLINNRLYSILLLIFLGNITLHAQEENLPAEIDSLERAYEELIQVEEESIRYRLRNYQFFAIGDESSDTLVQVRIRHPHFYDGSYVWLNEKLNDLAVNGSEPSIHRRNAAQTAAEIFTDYQTFLDDFPDYEISWYLFRYIEIIYEDSLLLTMLYQEERYLGGAHPNSFRMFFNLDKTQQKELSLYDIIIPEKAADLTRYAEKQFRHIRGLNFTGSINAAGFWFVDDQFSLSDNFIFTEEGLLFYYNPYDIAPYSMGSTELVLPYKEINRFLKEIYRR